MFLKFRPIFAHSVNAAAVIGVKRRSRSRSLFTSLFANMFSIQVEVQLELCHNENDDDKIGGVYDNDHDD